MLQLAEDSISGLLHSGLLIPIVAIVGGLTVGVIAIICGTISHVAGIRAREETRREIAAYVADGTLDADTAVAMIAAGADRKTVSSCCAGSGRGAAAMHAT